VLLPSLCGKRLSPRMSVSGVHFKASRKVLFLRAGFYRDWPISALLMHLISGTAHLLCKHPAPSPLRLAPYRMGDLKEQSFL
jgi:hypothetical protein